MQLKLFQHKQEEIVTIPSIPNERQLSPASENIPQSLSAPEGLVRRFRKLKALNQKHTYGIYASIVGWCLLPFGLDALANARAGSIESHFYYPLKYLLIYSSISLTMLNVQLWSTRKLSAAATQLSESDNVENIAPLLEALFVREPGHSHAVAGLARLVPLATRSNQHDLSIVHKRIIYIAIKQSSNKRIFWRYNPKLAVMLIELLGYIHDTESIPMLSRLSTQLGEEPEQKRILGAVRSSLERLSLESKPEITDEQAAELFLMPIDIQSKTSKNYQLAAKKKSDIFMSHFNEAVKVRKRNEKLVIWFSLSSIIEAVVSMVIGSSSAYKGMHIGLIIMAITSMTSIIGPLIYGTFWVKRLINQLSGTDSLPAIGPLSEVLVMEDSGLFAVSSILLQKLFPLLKASDSHLLNSNQRHCLNRALARARKSPRLAIALLKGLEQVGDGSSLEVVERLVNGSAHSVEMLQLQKAAQDCLPFLQSKHSDEIASKQLLRASSETNMSSGDLLRPVTASNLIESIALLRAHIEK